MVAVSPFAPLAVTVKLAAVPAATLRVVGEAANVKLGVGSGAISHNPRPWVAATSCRELQVFGEMLNCSTAASGRPPPTCIHCSLAAPPSVAAKTPTSLAT